MDAPRSFWSAVWARGPQSRLSRYTVANGVLYLTLGAGLYLLPASVVIRLFFLEHLTGYEEGLARAVGVTLAVIGWLYLMGGRTGAASFGLSTLPDRLMIPVLLVPLWLRGLMPLGMVLPFAILDPVLGIGAYVIWRREQGLRS